MNRRLNILMISSWDFQDHGMQVTQKTPRYLAENGHRVVFMTHRELTNAPAKPSRLPENLTVRRFEFPFRWLNRVPKVRRLRHLVTFFFCCAREVGRQRKAGFQPDLVYAAECDAILIGRILARRLRVPFVTRYYGLSTQLLARPLAHGLYSLAVRSPADMAIVTDDGTGGEHELRSRNRRIGRLCFWKNGVDAPDEVTESRAATRSRLGFDDTDVVFLTVSRLDGWKRVDRAIRAFARTVPDCPAARLVVVGGGDQRESLETLAQDLGTADRVDFVGRIPHNAVYAMYRAADVFLSLYDMSNLGNPLWEAMTTATCVVTLDTGATAEVIEDGVNGRILPVGQDGDDLASRLSAVLTELALSPKERARLGRGGADTAAAILWSWDTRLAAEQRALEELTGGIPAGAVS